MTLTAPVGTDGEAFRQCVEWHESRGNPTVVSASGLYYGLYQMGYGAWHYNNPDAATYANAAQAPADVQTAQFWRLYNSPLGKHPWAGDGC